MHICKTGLEGVYLLEPILREDGRGWFLEVYSRKAMEAYGLGGAFVQENHSFSERKGTLRGLHFQNAPRAQSKLVRCTAGSILDVAVDLRKGSPQYGKWVGAVLSAANRRQLFIPKGFAHGFLTREDRVEVQYLVDEVYAPEQERSVWYGDPELGIDWGGGGFILSEKDRNAPRLRNSDVNFVWEGNP